MSLQMTQQMALGGTAVEFEKSLNFYAGWREYFTMQIFGPVVLSIEDSIPKNLPDKPINLAKRLSVTFHKYT